MTDNETETGARPPLGALPLTALPFVAAALTLLGGCAQMPFPPLDALLSGQSEETSDAAASEAADDAGEEAADAIPEPQEDPEPGKLYEWSGNGHNVTRIVIDTNEQKARVYSGNQQIGWSTIASGVAKHPTPRGEFAILEKVRDKRSNLYGKIVNSRGKVIKASASGKDRVPAGARFVGARMPNFMRMTYDGIGMHAGPIPRPGRPASHGCIRMPSEFAATLFAHAQHGTAVTVVGNGPDYGNYAERVARQQAEERARRAAAEAAREGSPLDRLDAEVAVMREAESSDSTASASGAGGSPDRAGSDKPAEIKRSAPAGPERSIRAKPQRSTPARPEEPARAESQRSAAADAGRHASAEPSTAPARASDSEHAPAASPEAPTEPRAEAPATEPALESAPKPAPQFTDGTRAQAPAQEPQASGAAPQPADTVSPGSRAPGTAPPPPSYYPPPAAAPMPPYPYYPAPPTGVRSTGDAAGRPGLG